MKSKVFLSPNIEEQKTQNEEDAASHEPSTVILDENRKKGFVTNKAPFQSGSMRQKQQRVEKTYHQAFQDERRAGRDDMNQTRQHFSEEESCDANVETVDADSSTRSLNRQQSVSINRNIFELSLKLNELLEVPLQKLKSN